MNIVKKYVLRKENVVMRITLLCCFTLASSLVNNLATLNGP